MQSVQAVSEVVVKLLARDQGPLRLRRGAVGQVCVRVRAQVMALPVKASNQRAEITPPQEVAAKEERGLCLVPRQFIKDSFAALGVFMSGEDEGDPPLVCGAANDAAIADLDSQVGQRGLGSGAHTAIGVGAGARKAEGAVAAIAGEQLDDLEPHGSIRVVQKCLQSDGNHQILQ